MSEQSDETWAPVVGAVVFPTMIFLFVLGIVWIFSHFHDWDCGKHQGLLNPNGVYSYNNGTSNTPGTYHVEATATDTVCKDGYRP